MSLTNFEDQTPELTPEEMAELPAVIHSFRYYDKNNPIKASVIVTKMNIYLKMKGSKMKMTDVRLRRMVNYIRTNGLLPLIATSKGYFTSKNKQEIELQIKSLQERARSIQRCANGLKKFLEK